MKKVLIIDNYDSFTYNLVHYLEDLNSEVTVMRNDQLTLQDADPFQHIVLSPGPGLPNDAGMLKALIQHCASTKNILGVCLGHQAIAEVFGGQLINLDTVYHGVATNINITEDDVLFKGLPKTFEAGHYHSWVVDPNLPEALRATSVDENGHLMSLRHKTYNVWGLQYHPESILTPHGKQLLENWLNTQ
ncbi:MAG: aminodeoxychorismate/anthranilate synthase component II [Bacteroidota bacterium]